MHRNQRSNCQYSLNHRQSSVWWLSCVQLFVKPWTAVHQASLSITISWSFFKFMSISQGCHPAIYSSVIPFSSYLQSFPASGSFPVSQFLTSGGQSTSFSFSISPSNGYSGLISFRIDWSPCSSRDSQESVPTPQFKSINFLV